VFVLDTQQCPQATADDLGQCDAERHECAVLRVVREDGVQDPRETQQRVEEHDGVVDPDRTQRRNIAEQPTASVGLQQREIHEEVPNGAVDGVDSGKGDVMAEGRAVVLDTVDAEEDGSEDGHDILAAVGQVREDIACVVVTAQTLQNTPDGR